MTGLVRCIPVEGVAQGEFATIDAGAGCHPGGGIMGAPGYIAAKVVQKDMRFGLR